MSTVKSTLQSARNLIADPKHWIKFQLAENSKGHKVDPKDETATCWCSIGALEKITQNDYELNAACVRLHKNIGRFIGVATFNDSHTHAEVLELFDKAIASCEE